jgi:nucleotide-binding universal stress UspA family protein
VRDRKRASHLIEQADRIAETLEAPLQIVEHDGAPASKGERREAADIATVLRRLDAVLAVADASDPMVAAFIARPRYLREIATPLLLLRQT